MWSTAITCIEFTLKMRCLCEFIGASEMITNLHANGLSFAVKVTDLVERYLQRWTQATGGG